jgi:hypothetical protein
MDTYFSHIQDLRIRLDRMLRFQESLSAAISKDSKRVSTWIENHLASAISSMSMADGKDRPQIIDVVLRTKSLHIFSKYGVDP